jgi:A/G-specific adenine glycosylase
MLQQTRVATVIERYGEFLRRFPTLRSLAEADEADVLALWSGLGYYRRARMLHRGAQFVLREFRGKLPRTLVGLRTLPGVGDYTAAAIASIAFGQSVAVLDGNVERVLLRVLGREEQKSARARAQMVAIAQLLIPPASAKSTLNAPGDHNQAMMELGATVCLPRAPLCSECPVAEFCRTRGEHATPVRERQHSRIVAHLLAVRKRGTSTEVLLERRNKDAGQMPGMLELPPLPLESIAGREPVLRLRHAITNTNYYVQVYSEHVPGVQPEPRDDRDSDEVGEPIELHAAVDDSGEDDLFVADPSELSTDPTLLDELPAAADREWVPAARLQHLPLTGLARKALQRLGVMAMPKVQIG